MRGTQLLLARTQCLPGTAFQAPDFGFLPLRGRVRERSHEVCTAALTIYGIKLTSLPC